MSQELVEFSGQLAQLAQAAQIADQFAQAEVLSDYRRGKAPRTLSGQREAIAVFETFLTEAGVPIQGMADNLALWTAISQGLVKAFVRWQLTRGYRIGSLNHCLSTIRTYARLAAEAGFLSQDRYQAITLVHTISKKEGRNIDAEREVTSLGAKKREPTRIGPSHVALIKQQLRALARQGDTLASRDFLLFCLLADHGLRCSEAANLSRTSLDLSAGILHIYRHKTDRRQLHRLTPDALEAAQIYVRTCAIEAQLFAGEKPGTGLATRSINARLGVLGRLADLSGLSPHDLRHYYATYSKGDVGALQQAGGWSSPVMPLLYRVESEIANAGVLVPGQPGWELAR